MNRRLRDGLVCIVVVALLTSGGCLTLNPAVHLDPGNSTVFENASSAGTWASGRVVTPIHLTANATVSQGVNRINVVAGDGRTFYTTPVDSGQSNLTVMVPTSENATVVAVNTVNATVVDSRNLTISGKTLV